MSHDGRVIAKRPGADLSGNGDDEATVWPEMVKNYKLELSITVQGIIFPVLTNIYYRGSYFSHFF
jgi:hypothetical protein